MDKVKTVYLLDMIPLVSYRYEWLSVEKKKNVLERRKKIMFEPNVFKLDYEAYNENGRAN